MSTFVYNISNNTGGYKLRMTPTLLSTTIAILSGLLFSVAYLYHNKWHAGKRFGLIMLAGYCICMAVNVLVEVVMS